MGAGGPKRTLSKREWWSPCRRLDVSRAMAVMVLEAWAELNDSEVGGVHGGNNEEAPGEGGSPGRGRPLEKRTSA